MYAAVTDNHREDMDAQMAEEKKNVVQLDVKREKFPDRGCCMAGPDIYLKREPEVDVIPE